jgi:hypothetical protein
MNLGAIEDHENPALSCGFSWYFIRAMMKRHRLFRTFAACLLEC